MEGNAVKKEIEKQTKIYQKPSWEKQQLFERFSMTCTTKSPCSVTRTGFAS
jgi:hypothetical protein